MERKKFLQISGGLLAGLALSNVGCTTLVKNTNTSSNVKPFGLQLYSIKDDFIKDPKGIFKKVAAAGYHYVEGFELDKGLFWGMTNKEFKQHITDAGLTLTSCLGDLTKDFEKKVTDAAAIGMEYLIHQYYGKRDTLDEYKQFAEQLNKWGSIAQKNGVKVAYHNHDYSFAKQDGTYPHDIFMQYTDPSLVYFQMDMYWVSFAGENPIDWLRKYPNRFQLCHVKDRIKGSSERNASCSLGTGNIDYTTILKEVDKYGMKYLLVEHERYDQCTPMQCMIDDANWMKNFMHSIK